MTTNPWLQPPAADEYDPYYGTYVSLVPPGDFLVKARAQLNRVTEFFSSLPAEKAEHAYAPGKWTIKEVLAHLIDTERVFGYRALHFARGDASPLPGFDQDAWSPTTWAAGRALPSVLGEWQAVRRALLAFAEGLDPELLDRRGIASGREFSVRAPLFIVVGHVEYHLAHLREHYL